MTEKPILFSGPMVRAILDGRKTQTRRVIPFGEKGAPHGDFWVSRLWSDVCVWVANLKPESSHPRKGIKYRYGQAGDRLWVRETFVIEEAEKPPVDDRPYKPYIEPGEFHHYLVPRYRATEPEPHIVPWDICDGTDDRTRWSPSIFMQKWACRIKLEITGVRVERLQDISEGDAIAEGVGHGFQMNSGWPDYLHIKDGVCTLTQDTAKMSFSTLWDSINSKRGYPWSSNCWVWVLEFKRIEA